MTSNPRDFIPLFSRSSVPAFFHPGFLMGFAGFLLWFKSARQF